MKLSFVFLVFAFLIFASFNVSASLNDRSLPTIYKVTGNIDIENYEDNFYFLAAYVTHNSNDYVVGKSSCLNYNNFNSTLSTGIFIGPIPSIILPQTSKTFDLHLSVKQYANQSTCNNANGLMEVIEGETSQGSNLN